jgi:MFS family permease
MNLAKTERAGANGPSRFALVLRSLRHRNYLLFFSGQLVSLIGTWMQTVAQSWLVYRLTGSTLLLGIVGFSSQIPVFLVATLGGAVADHYERRRIIVATQTASMILAFILAWLTLSGNIREWHILVLSAALGIVNAFDIPARQAFLVEMVGREDLTNAIALNSSMFNGARVVGPAIAGLLVAAIGEGWCFFANAVSYIAVLAGLFMMKLKPWSRSLSEVSTVGRIVEGFRFVGATGPVWALLSLVGIVSVAGMPYSVLMPIFADRILHRGAEAMGLLMGATGVGALTGALLLAGRTGVKGLGRWIVVSTIGFGVSLILFAVSRSFWLSMALLVPAGCGMMVMSAASNTLIQVMVPNQLRGRVMAVYSMVFMGMAPLGALLAGVLADRTGAPAIVALGGLLCIAAGGIFATRLPTIRVQARRLMAALDTGATEAQEVLQRL